MTAEREGRGRRWTAEMGPKVKNWDVLKGPSLRPPFPPSFTGERIMREAWRRRKMWRDAIRENGRRGKEKGERFVAVYSLGEEVEEEKQHRGASKIGNLSNRGKVAAP